MHLLIVRLRTSADRSASGVTEVDGHSRPRVAPRSGMEVPATGQQVASSRTATTVSRWSICGSAGRRGGRLQGRSRVERLRSAGTPAVSSISYPPQTSNQEPATLSYETHDHDVGRPVATRAALGAASGVRPEPAESSPSQRRRCVSVVCCRNPIISITTGAPRRTAPPPDARHRSLRRCSAARRGADRMTTRPVHRTWQSARFVGRPGLPRT
jgi:hypothetical protein